MTSAGRDSPTLTDTSVHSRVYTLANFTCDLYKCVKKKLDLRIEHLKNNHNTFKYRHHLNKSGIQNSKIRLLG